MSIQLKDKVHKSSSFIDEQFQPGQFSHCQLLVQVGLEGMCLAVLDTRSNKFIGLERFDFQSVSHMDILPELIELAFSESSIVAANYPKTTVSIINNLSTLVPEALFEKDRMKAYLKFNANLEGDEFLMADPIKTMNAQNVFALPIAIKMKLDAYFHRVEYHHFSSGILSAVLQQAKNKNKKQLYVHIQQTHFEILVTDTNQLLFYNSFQYQTAEDLLYYLLFVTEQLELNPELIETTVIGEIEKNSNLMNLIRKYIKHVNLGSRADESELSYQLQTLPKHVYFSLLNPYYL